MVEKKMTKLGTWENRAIFPSLHANLRKQYAQYRQLYDSRPLERHLWFTREINFLKVF